MTNKSRNWVFTLNNYTDDDIRLIDSIDCQYYCYGQEVSESGTPHLQGYIRFQNQVRFNFVKKLLPSAHLEIMRGTSDEAINYCKKDGMWTDKGTPPSQGRRCDLIKLRDDIVNGKRVDDICQENPDIVFQYGRVLDRLEDIHMRTVFRKEMTKCIWYVGPTGVGKSHNAYAGFTPETHYVVPNDNGWWDGYKQQATVIINDFRGEMKYNELLQLIDKWPYSVKRRGREPMPFTSSLVIITSSLSPSDIYCNRHREDKLEQLLRRIEIRDLAQKCSEGNTITSEPTDEPEDDLPDNIKFINLLINDI